MVKDFLNKVTAIIITLTIVLSIGIVASPTAYAQRVTCSYCGGSRFVSSNCSSCGGMGDTMCRMCGGSGGSATGSLGGYHRCFSCMGRGYQRCYKCSGTGKVREICPSCSGRGTYDDGTPSYSSGSSSSGSASNTSPGYSSYSDGNSASTSTNSSAPSGYSSYSDDSSSSSSKTSYYKITYKLNGGKNNSKNPKRYKKSTSTITLKSPKRKGYTFKGWYTNKKLTKRIYRIKKGSKGNKTLYAKWSKNTYKITYKLNGGKNSSKNPKKYTVTTKTVTLKKPTRKGYTFKGWYTNKELTKRIYRIKKGSAGDKTLYAKWSKTKYKITYKLDGGKNNSKNPKKFTITTKTITLKKPTKKGYAFKGWYTNKKLTKKITKITKGSTGNKTVYAKWSKKSYEITYKLNGGKNNSKNPQKYTITTSTITLKEPTRKSYTFKGWYTNKELSKRIYRIKKGSAGAKTLYAKWAKTYNITYKLNGGKNSTKNPKTYTKIDSTIKLKKPTKTGYTFNGWYTDKKLTKKITKITKDSAGNKTLYAKWVKIYTVTYKLNGGKNNSKNPKIYTKIDSTITLKNPTRQGYTFKGWYSDSKFSKKVTKISKGSTGNKTLYAKWDIEWSYKISKGKVTITGIDTAVRGAVTIPSKLGGYPVTVIGDKAFLDFSNITSVKIPNSVTSIGYEAFDGCKGLTSIEIPNSVTSIGDAAFCWCTGLTSIEIPSNVTSIGDAAFACCTGLTSIEIPSNVTSIGTNAFYGCEGLNKVNYTGSIDKWCNIDFVHDSNPLEYAHNLYINNKKVENLVIPGNVKNIKDYAFSGCDGLKSITIPNSVKTIGKGAFYRCKGLTSITIPNSVTSIGECAFEWCTGLTSIEIPNSVTSIGDSAFSDCTGLKSITVKSGNKKYHSAGNCLIETKSKKLVIGCKKSVIPTDGSVTSIGDSAFYGCTGLTSITIPNSVTSIGDSAFCWCTGLTSITIPNSVTSIGECAFEWCTGLTSIEIPNSVTSIGDSAFYWCKGLKTITIPNSVTSIGEVAFGYCTGLTSIEIPNSVTSIDRYAFGCTGLKDVYYTGSKQEWNNIIIDDGNDELQNATIHYNK